MSDISEVINDYKANLSQKKSFDYSDSWLSFRNGQLVTVLADSFIDLDNFVSTVLIKYLEDDKRVAVVNFGYGGNLKTLERFIYTCADDDFYLTSDEKINEIYTQKTLFNYHKPYSIAELLAIPKIQKMMDYFKNKNLLFFDNVKSIKTLFDELQRLKDLDLIILKNIDNTYIRIEDIESDEIAETLKFYSEKLNIPILVTTQVSEKFELRIGDQIRINDGRLKNAELYSDTVVILNNFTGHKLIEAVYRNKNEYQHPISFCFKQKRPYNLSLLELTTNFKSDKKEKSESEIYFEKYWDFFHEGVDTKDNDEETFYFIQQAFVGVKDFIEHNEDLEIDFHKLKDWVNSLSEEVFALKRKPILKTYLDNLEDKKLLNILYYFLEKAKYKTIDIDDNQLIRDICQDK